ncbi:MAG: hypothetical protein AAF757_01505 [Cyanobacteria bacterium P01_D01_bin.116]
MWLAHRNTLRLLCPDGHAPLTLSLAMTQLILHTHLYALTGGEVIEAKNGKDIKGTKEIEDWGYNGTIAICNKELNKTFIYWHFDEGSIDEVQLPLL